MSALAEDLHRLADVLDRDDVYNFVADAIATARDKAPRAHNDRDTGDVLNDLIAALRAAT